MSNYQTWIENWLEKNSGPNEDGYGQCKQAAEEMAKAFPELAITKGHAYCPSPWNRRDHWWLKTATGEIVDPTAKQFPLIFEYEEYFPGMHIRLGKCMECGAEIMGPESLEGVYSTTFCSEACAQATAAYLGW